MIELQQRLFITLYLVFLLIFLVFNPFATLLNKASAQTTTNENASLLYRNSTLGISMDHPTSWKKIDQGKTFVKFAPSPVLFSQLEISVTSKNSTLGNPYIVGTPSNATLGHYPATKVISIRSTPSPYLVPREANVGPEPVKTMDVYTLKGDKVYHVRYMSELSTFDTYLAVVEKMINSFRIINK